jgi:hypothetical protein
MAKFAAPRQMFADMVSLIARFASTIRAGMRGREEQMWLA